MKFLLNRPSGGMLYDFEFYRPSEHSRKVRRFFNFNFKIIYRYKCNNETII